VTRRFGRTRTKAVDGIPRSVDMGKILRGELKALFEGR
jgi:hypothetical protein